MRPSAYLFATPSILSGFSRLVDLCGTFYAFNESATPDEADKLALYADWLAVGGDLEAAMKNSDFEVYQKAIEEFRQESAA